MKPVREPNLPWREVEGRAVILSPKRGEVHELNEVGSFLWSAADGTASLESVTRRLIESFEIDESRADCDVRQFYEELEGRGLIRWE